MASRPSFFSELKRRNVYRVGAMYAVAGWVAVQGATQVLPVYDVANWVIRLLVTVIILGFPVALLLSWVFELTPKGLVRTAAAVEAGAPVSQSEYEFAFVALLLVLTAGLIAIAVRAHFGIPAPAATPLRIAPVTAAPATEAQTTPAQARSIAVLPFENLSADPANAYFAAGIQNEILTRLAKIGSLKVISRTSTAHYANKPDDLPKIARQLGVATVLEGSVQRAGDTVRINVQLIRAATDDHLWAETYLRRLDDIFSIESEVAGAIAERLDAALSGPERQTLARRPTQSAAAYDAYLKGIALAARSDESLEHLQAMIRFHTEAVTADPGFAEAWSELSESLVGLYLSFDHTERHLAAAKDAVDTALRLQPQLPEAWMALGSYRAGLDDWEGALEAYQHALPQLPNSALLAIRIASAKRHQGRWEEWLAAAQQAATLDPRNATVWESLGFGFFALRRFEDARESYRHALALQPGNALLIAAIASASLAEGDTAAAAGVLAATKLDPRRYHVALAFSELWQQRREYATGLREWTKALEGEKAFVAYDAIPAHLRRGTLAACAGLCRQALTDFAAARARLEALERSGDTSPFIYIFLGPVRAALGDRAGALAAAKRGVQLSLKDIEVGANARLHLA